METTEATEPQKEEPYLYQHVGYYERDGVWYGPCTTVVIYKTRKEKETNA